MDQANQAEPHLGPGGAFVVQLRSDADVTGRRICGRIEHLMSGDSAPFTSLEMLLSFMAKHTSAASPAREAR